jgi:hypothetical protein
VGHLRGILHPGLTRPDNGRARTHQGGARHTVRTKHRLYAIAVPCTAAYRPGERKG